MSEKDIREKLEFHRGAESVPVIIHYGDSLWKKKWFSYELIDLPGGRSYGNQDLIPPTLPARKGQYVTKEETGHQFYGLGSIAANLTEVGGTDQFESLKLVLTADEKAAGIAFVNRHNYILDWIDRSHVPGI